MSKPLAIALAQINPTLGALDDNLEKIRRARDEAGGKADLILFPEMIVCGYPPEDLVLKPFFLDSVENHVHKLVDESADKGPALLISAPWRIEGKTYNAALLIANGKIEAVRTKHHLPDYGVFDENRVFASGPADQPPVPFKGHNLGLLICEDMWHADVAQNLKTQGADVLLVPNGSPFTVDKRTIRRAHAAARVSETGLPLLYVNQIGGQDELVFDGGSFVMDTNGTVTEELPRFEECVKIVSLPCHPCGAAKQSLSAGIHNDSGKTADLAAIYAALTLALRDYVRKNNFPGVLIGLSGGIDSALSAVIAADALGPDKVHCVMMPSRFTAQESLDDAAQLAKNLGVQYDILSIEQPVKAFENLIPAALENSLAHENIQPRTRGILLMALSNASGKMVLSTGNKSEMAVGYATLYGDMCGGFNVLKDLYKTQVYALSRWRNEQGRVIPENILTRPPTAELKENQTDQDTLPPYEELDDILHSLIEKDMSVEEIESRGHNRETITRVWRMLDRAEYKRRQAPPGVKITSRAFGRDRRYPITNGFLNIITKP